MGRGTLLNIKSKLAWSVPIILKEKLFANLVV
jgi:hypothetical protein